MRLILLVSLAALSLAGCDAQPKACVGQECGDPVTPMKQEEAEKIVADAHASFTSGDAFKIMEHYAPGASVFDPGHVEASTDRATQTKWAADFVAMKPSDLVTQSKEVRILGGDTIVASGIAAFLAQIGPNRERVSARYTQVYHQQPDGRWLIVHEHMSMPPAPPGPGA